MDGAGDVPAVRSGEVMVLNVLDLFSGIGGFSLGLESTGGFRTAAFCDNDQHCQAVLRKHWPNVPIHDDVRELDATGLGRIDLVCGGFPCQPFSLAGKRRGTSDDRYLWPEMRRIIETVRPTWVIAENVAGLGSMVLEHGPLEVESRSGGRNANGVDYISVLLRQERMLLGAICDDFSALDYAVQPFVVPACAVDAPHRRDRVWIVAHTNGSGYGRTQEPGLHRTAQGERQADNAGNGNRTSADVADADRARPQRRVGAELQKCADEWVVGSRGSSKIIADATSNGRGENVGAFHCAEAGRQEARQSAGHHAGDGQFWQSEPNVGRVANGIPNRVDRLRALGNAVVPQIPEIIGQAILASMQEADLRGDGE